jgi:BA14K-like protein
MNVSARLCAVALLAASTWSLSAPAGAAPIIAPLSLQNATSSVETVQWRGWGWGVGAGIATGLIVGGAIAASQYPYGYGPYPYGYYGPAPVYAAPPVYGAPPAYGAPVAGDAVAYCSRRYRSYDPASGTFLGYDGVRHPCP